MNIRECDTPNLKKMGIYCITNLVNGKKYIGKTGRKYGFIDRWKHHLNELIKNKNECTYLQNTFNKYGIDNFEFSIIEIIEPLEDKTILNNILNFWEKYYINYYDTYNRDKGYNLTKGGDGVLGLLLSYETKQKMSELKKQLFIEGKLIPHNKGKSKENYEPLKNASIKLSNRKILWKNKISKTMKENGTTKGKNNGMFNNHILKGRFKGINSFSSIPIVQLTLNNELVREYNYIKEVKDFGFCYEIVCKCINHKYKDNNLGNNIYGLRGKEKYKWFKKDEYYEIINKGEKNK